MTDLAILIDNLKDIKYSQYIDTEPELLEGLPNLGQIVPVKKKHSILLFDNLNQRKEIGHENKNWQEWN